MHIVLISYDTTILDKKSSAYARMREYCRRIDRLTVVVISGGVEQKIIDNTLEIYMVGGVRGLRVYRAKKLLEKIHTRHPVSLISSQDAFESAMIASHFSSRYSVPFEIQLHGDFYSSNYWRKKSMVWRMRLRYGIRVLRNADHIRVVSERIKKSLQEFGIDDKKISIIPVTTSVRRPEENHDTSRRDISSSQKDRFSGKFVILVVGRLTHEKHIDLVARSLSYISGFVPNAVCVVLGEGPERDEIAAVAKSLGEAERIFFEGHIIDTSHYYERADVVVIPSWTEGYGRTAIEAMAYGKPVVITDVGLAGEIVHNEYNGLIVPVDNDGALAESLVRVATDKTLAEKLSKNATLTFSKLPTNEELFEEVIKKWRSVAN